MATASAHEFRSRLRVGDFIVVGVVLAGIVGLWVCIGIFMPTKTAKPSEFGEQFGAVSALFSGLGFAGLVITILLQQRQLALHGFQLAMQDAELKRQMAQLQKQNTHAEQQMFEGRLFEMLRLLRECVREVEATSDRGTAAFDRLFDDLQRRYRESPPDARPRFRAQAAFGAFWDDYGVVLGRYFRNVVAIIEMVADSPVRRNVYVKILAAQSSEAERMMQFYFVVSNKCGTHTREMAQQLQLFSGLARRGLLDEEHGTWVAEFAR